MGQRQLKDTKQGCEESKTQEVQRANSSYGVDFQEENDLFFVVVVVTVVLWRVKLRALHLLGRRSTT
jgi:hypothetical protein